MGRKPKNAEESEDMSRHLPGDDGLVDNLEENLDDMNEDDYDEDSEDKGIDEILGGATLGRAGSDIDGWGGGEDYEG